MRTSTLLHLATGATSAVIAVAVSAVATRDAFRLFKENERLNGRLLEHGKRDSRDVEVIDILADRIQRFQLEIAELERENKALRSDLDGTMQALSSPRDADNVGANPFIDTTQPEPAGNDYW